MSFKIYINFLSGIVIIDRKIQFTPILAHDSGNLYYIFNSHLQKDRSGTLENNRFTKYFTNKRAGFLAVNLKKDVSISETYWS